MSDREMQAWLGPAYDETTPEQRDALEGAWATIEDRWPGEDDSDLRQHALSGAAMTVLGDSTDAQLVAEYLAAHQAAMDAHARMTGAIIRAAQDETEVAIAERLGLSRKTVRRALGK